MRSSETRPRPTESELAILNVLWARGEATVREVHEVLYRDDAGYTTALKILQVMHAKGLVVRDDRQRAHVYRAAVGQADTQTRLLDELMRRLFNGRPADLVLSALGGEAAPSDEELAQIRALLDRIEQRRHGA